MSRGDCKGRAPRQIGTATNWVSVSTDDDHTVAIRSNGTLWALGFNIPSRLADGTSVMGGNNELE